MSIANGPEVPGGVENVPTPQLTIWRLIGPWVLARLKAAADAEERRKPWGRW